MLSLELKKQTIEGFRTGDSDTGSSAVQIALITERINQLNKHFGEFSKDYASRVGLMRLVGKRRRLLRYLAKKDKRSYMDVIKRLGLRE